MKCHEMLVCLIQVEYKNTTEVVVKEVETERE